MGLGKKSPGARGRKLKGEVIERIGHALRDDDLIVRGKADQILSDLKRVGKKVKDAAKNLCQR